MIVIDTSVVVKWAIDEIGADAAREFIDRNPAAPDLIVFELGHVLTKKVRLRQLDPSSASLAHRRLPQLLQLASSRPLDRRAFDLALALHHAIADCYFLALAESLESELITADRVFVDKVRAALRSPAIRLLGEAEA